MPTTRPTGTPTGGASLSELIGIVNAAFVGIFNAGQQERARKAATVLEAACAQAGWSYRRLQPLEQTLAANLKWLAGYRHPRNAGPPPLAAAVRQAFAQPRPLIEGAEAVGDPIAVLPAVFHALWHGHLTTPLDVPLHERALLSPGPGTGGQQPPPDSSTGTSTSTGTGRLASRSAPAGDRPAPNGAGGSASRTASAGAGSERAAGWQAGPRSRRARPLP